MEKGEIIMKTEEGQNQLIICYGQCPESKFSFKDLVNLDLKDIAIYQKQKQQITIKNNFKYPSVYEVDQNKLPEGLTINPPKGKINSEDQKILNIEFLSNTEKR